VDKKQPVMLPASLDDYVPEDHFCRVIDAFTKQLDMAMLGTNTLNAKIPAVGLMTQCLKNRLNSTLNLFFL